MTKCYWLLLFTLLLLVCFLKLFDFLRYLNTRKPTSVSRHMCACVDPNKVFETQRLLLSVGTRERWDGACSSSLQKSVWPMTFNLLSRLNLLSDLVGNFYAFVCKIFWY